MDDNANEKETQPYPNKQTDRLLATCGYLLVVFSVFCFGAIGYLKIYQVINKLATPEYKDFFGFFQQESSTIVLLIVGYITISMGKSLITEVRITDNRTIPTGRLHELNSSNKTEVFAATTPLFAVFQDKPNVE